MNNQRGWATKMHEKAQKRVFKGRVSPLTAFRAFLCLFVAPILPLIFS